MASNDLQDLVDRYVGVWNEPDPERRRNAIRTLWAEDGVHILQPPEQIRKVAHELGFTSTVLEARGYAELDVRVTRAYQDFVAPGKFSFRSRNDADRLHGVVKFRWEMVSTAGEVAGVGLEILMLAPDGRISADYQFIET